MRVDTELTDVPSSEANAADHQAGSTPESTPALVIESTSGWAALNLRDLWRYRELLYFLTWRDVKVRYAQTTIGVVWAMLQPLLTTLVFWFVFSRLGRVSSDGLPYPIFAYSALVPWVFFTTSLNQAGTSLVTNSNMISKIYFPRLIMPTAAVLAGIVDMAVAFVVLPVMMLYYGIAPGPALLTLPLFVLLAFMTVLGITLWLSALNVKYRDIRYTIPFLTQIWLFTTPIFYPSSMLSERGQFLIGLNPLAGVVEGFRWALLGVENPPGGMILVSATVVVMLFVGGLFYFRRMEREFADVV